MILVDMEMPKSCRFCHLQDVCVPFQREVVTEVVSIDTLNERHKDCPIKSVEGLIEKIEEKASMNHGDSDLNVGVTVGLAYAIGIIKEYCEVSEGADSD